VKVVPATAANIVAAGDALRRGELVGMPTETVYGVAALASNPDAIRRTFTVKGRPADNPLIVHLASLDQLSDVARELPPAAQILAERFWPGPLTLVLPKCPGIPDAATAGLDTVAVRVPAHPVALRLIEAAGGPLTAPSANPFMGLSATRAADVDAAVADGLAMVLDGGPCEVGLESTVVDCSEGEPRILRPGGTSRADIEAALGRSLESGGTTERKAPGMYARHYAPSTPLRIAASLGAEDAGLVFGSPSNANQIAMPAKAAPYAIRLYAELHRLDECDLPEILVQAPPETSEWEAVWDRLRKAATSAE